MSFKVSRIASGSNHDQAHDRYPRLNWTKMIQGGHCADTGNPINIIPTINGIDWKDKDPLFEAVDSLTNFEFVHFGVTD